MREFVEKLIERLENRIKYNKSCHEEFSDAKMSLTYEVQINAYKNAIEIINQLAEEYKLLENIEQLNNGWIPVSKRLPKDDRNTYMVQTPNGSIRILGFTKDAYKLSKYDFSEYKGKKKTLFYEYDGEYGYYEVKCVAWQPLPALYKEGE